MGTARPNPSVGAVIVYNDVIIGEGFTSVYGQSHAEVNAIASVQDKSLLKEATIYVTLEPCAHFGKTPPCADLIVKHHLKKVVIGCVDTNSLVSGKGIERLEKAGIEVIVGVLEDECRRHHKRFFTNQEQKRPYIILKWAETKDRFVAPLTKNKQQPVWISSTYSKQLVHKWRAEEHAILVGTNTVLADNPNLTVRTWSGQNPIRIVLDKNLRLPKEANVFDGAVKTIVFYAIEKQKKLQENLAISKNETDNTSLVFEAIDFSNAIASQICRKLHGHKIQSVIIEGGTQTLQTFIDENLWDEARVFTGDISFEKGINAPVLKKNLKKQIYIKNDVLKIYMND